MNARRALVALPLAASLALAPLALAEPRRAAKGAPAATKPKKAVVNTTGPLTSFVGFRAMEDGSSRIYVDVASSVPVEERREGGALHYFLRGARVASRNATNWLVTTHWNTPVKRARLVPGPDGVELLIELRADSAPSQRLAPGPRGGATLQIDFPAGTFPQLDEPLTDMGPKKKKKKTNPDEELPTELGGPPTDVLPVDGAP